MIFLGYNFLQDRTCWQPVPTDFTNITDIKIQNGIYDHFNISKDVDFPYITTYPGEWDLSTQLNAGFNGNANAGNVGYVIAQMSSIRIKRRKKGTFDWYTLYDIPVTDFNDVNFVRKDFIAQNDTEYEYAIVPLIGNVEGEYSINSIKSEFYGIFLTNGKESFRFKENVSYNSNQQVRKSAIYEPFGSKFPIVATNGKISYEKGSLGGDIIVIDDNEQLDRKETVKRLEIIKNFLSESSAKILKDFNGNIWLVTLNDSMPITYYNEVGMGFARIEFNWTEVGDADNGRDLYKNNLIDSEN